MSTVDISHEEIKSAIAAKFDQAAKAYDQNAHVQQQIASVSLDKFRQVQPANCNVLVDLGCGTAQARRVLSQYSNAYIGLDLSYKMLHQAASFTSNNDSEYSPSWIQADAEQLPFADASIDAYYSSMALQWCASPQSVMAQINRTLTARGTATLAIMVEGSFNRVHQAWQHLDLPTRLNTFTNANEWIQAANQHTWKCSHSIEEFDTQHSGLVSMLKSIKSVGANTKHTASSVSPEQALSTKRALSSKRGFISRAEINAVEAYLTQQNTSKAFVLTYNILFITIQK